MISPSIGKSLSRSLVTASAALLFHIGPAAAADRGRDAQMQAGDLLSGTSARPSAVRKVSSAAPGGAASQSGLDPQEQARRAILGIASLSAGASKAAAVNSNPTSSIRLVGRSAPHARGDAQDMARRMILGQAG